MVHWSPPQPEVDLVRQGVWLLSHLTAGQGGTARGALAGRPEVLSSIKVRYVL